MSRQATTDSLNQSIETNNEASNILQGIEKYHLNVGGDPRGRRSFSGRIRVLSLSPMGEIDGMVLEDGGFVEIPPYAWIDGLDLKIGDVVAGAGEIKLEKPHTVFTRATLFKNEILLADANLSASQTDELVERHRHAKNDLALRLGDELAHQRLEIVEGTLMAVGLRSPAEVDRLILENRMSVHIPTSMTVLLGEIEIGESLKVQGRVISFSDGTFVQAKKIVTDRGETLT